MEELNKNIDKIIIVDPGKNTVKGLCYDKNFNLLGKLVFPSIIKKKHSFRDTDTSSELQFQIEYENSKYLVGEGVLSNYNFEVSKNTLHHKICVDTVIAHFVSEENERIHLVVGYPSSDYTNIDQLNEYIKLLQGSGYVNLKINNQQKSFKIVSIGIKPEGIAIKPRIEEIKEKTKVIDIGGEHINYRYYDEKGNTLDSDSIDSVGLNHLESHIKTILRKCVDVRKIDLDSINYMDCIKKQDIEFLKPGDINGYKSSKEFMDEVILDFVEDKIINKLDSKGISLYKRGDIVLFTGGGSILLQKYLEKVLENNKNQLHFSKTAYWDNCISYAIKDISDRTKELDGDIKEHLRSAQNIITSILKEANHLSKGDIDV